MSKHYLVYSPQMEGILGTGHYEPFACAVFVEAKNKREAKSKAIKLNEMLEWVQQQRGDSLNPFKGLKCNESICEHGICYCDKCSVNCSICDKLDKESSQRDNMMNEVYDSI